MLTIAHLGVERLNYQVRLLLNKRANPNVRREADGSTPLHNAAASGHATVVRQLVLHASTDVNAADAAGATALHRAAEKRRPEAMRELLQTSAVDVNRRTKGQRVTALFYPALGGDAEMTRRLLDRGADPMLPDAEGWLPLHFAAQAGRRAVVEALVKAGSQVNYSAAAMGETPLCVAAEQGRWFRVNKVESSL